MNSAVVLEKKAAELRAFIAGRDESIAVLKAERDQALATEDRKIAAAEVAAASLRQQREDLIAEAEHLDYRADHLAAAARRWREIAQRRRAEAAVVPTGQNAIIEARASRASTTSLWAERIVAAQDGELRRKIAQLQKLERRILAKAQTPSRGTGCVEIDAASRNSPLRRYLKTTEQLREARSRKLFNNPDYKGPPEEAFLKALDNIRSEMTTKQLAALSDDAASSDSAIMSTGR